MLPMFIVTAVECYGCYRGIPRIRVFFLMGSVFSSCRDLAFKTKKQCTVQIQSLIVSLIFI